MPNWISHVDELAALLEVAEVVIEEVDVLVVVGGLENIEPPEALEREDDDDVKLSELLGIDSGKPELVTVVDFDGDFKVAPVELALAEVALSELASEVAGGWTVLVVLSDIDFQDTLEGWESLVVHAFEEIGEDTTFSETDLALETNMLLGEVM